MKENIYFQNIKYVIGNMLKFTYIYVEFRYIMLTVFFIDCFRACRLKKKAQHEANKIKLLGLEYEHSNFSFYILFKKK